VGGKVKATCVLLMTPIISPCIPLLLLFFPCFEKMKVGLCGLHDVCVYLDLINF
jgi:hypothetical protein